MRYFYILLVFFLLGCNVQSATDGKTDTRIQHTLAAPGRIEGASQNIDLGYPGTALVGEVLVHEGESVSRNQVLVRMDCEDLKDELRSAQAEHAAAQEDLTRLVRGARSEEIEVARAEAEEANAHYNQILAHLNRVTQMEKKAFSSADYLDSVKRDLAVATSQKEAASQRLELLKKGALPEEIRRSRHTVEAFAARKESIRSKLAKCDIVSPVNGIILRVHVEKGELVSALRPIPVISVADISRLRVRAEIDELDIGQVVVGQKAQVITDGFEGKVLYAVVQELGLVMGRKSIRSIDPAEKSDRDILEVVLGLEEGTYSLPIGLRVTILLNIDQQGVNHGSGTEISELNTANKYSIRAFQIGPSNSSRQPIKKKYCKVALGYTPIHSVERTLASGLLEIPHEQHECW